MDRIQRRSKLLSGERVKHGFSKLCLKRKEKKWVQSQLSSKPTAYSSYCFCYYFFCGFGWFLLDPLSCEAVSCEALSCEAVSCEAVSCEAVSCEAIPCEAIPCEEEATVPLTVLLILIRDWYDIMYAIWWDLRISIVGTSRNVYFLQFL